NFLELNPRAIERIITLISIAINSCDIIKAKNYSKHFVFMASLRIVRPDLYEHYKTGKIHSDIKDSPDFFKWARKYYTNQEWSEIASNVITINLLEDACRILDIYELPSIEETMKMSKK
ncbi:hypothetical protein JW935_17745, partial [candidate division KSB1 bacterium]|nr:hypothetical protein [candidate division KSB1 bacterium]